MTTKKIKSGNDQDADDMDLQTDGGTLRMADGSVRVWSSVGVTIPIQNDPPAFLRFSFGHERIAKKGTAAEVSRVADAVDEFNENELQKRLKKYVRMVRVISNDPEHEEKPKGKGKKSGRDRAMKRLGH